MRCLRLRYVTLAAIMIMSVAALAKADGVGVILDVEITEVLVPSENGVEEWNDALDDHLRQHVMSYLQRDFGAEGMEIPILWPSPSVGAYAIVVGLTERGCRVICYHSDWHEDLLPKPGHRYDVYFTSRPLVGVHGDKMLSDPNAKQAIVYESSFELPSKPIMSREQWFFGADGFGEIMIRNAEVVGLSDHFTYGRVTRVRTEMGCELDLYPASSDCADMPQIGRRYDFVCRQQKWLGEGFDSDGSVRPTLPYALVVDEIVARP